jgi:glycosyltransferase involved in cell wall biosynthesis
MNEFPPGRRFSPPLVSVIVNNYNYGRFLRDAVDSVFAQTYPQIECIIVDDASTDESPAVLADIAAVHPQAKIITRTVNGNQLAAALDGLAASTGDYILFLDSDDFLLDQCVATQVFVNLSLRVPVGFTCSDMLQIARDRLIFGSALSVANYVKLATPEMKPMVRPLPEELAGSWNSEAIDQSVLDRLYSVDIGNKGWPWATTSAFFFRHDALNLWIDTPGLVQCGRSLDGFFGRAINAITGSVLIDQALVAFRSHGANNFNQKSQLANLHNYDERKDLEHLHRRVLLDEVLRDPTRFRFTWPGMLKIVLETFDTAKKLPLLSFVVVNHNYGRFLRACVDSIMGQKYDNIECIVVDNASTDNSRNVIDSLVRQYPSLKILHNRENIGQSAACIAGLALTNGSYVAFIDADDYLLACFAATHIRVHLTVPFAVGFSSSDMAQTVNDTVVLGNYVDSFGPRPKAASIPIEADCLRDIRDVSEVLETHELESSEFLAKVRLVSKSTVDWVWAPTSSNVYRRDAVLPLANNPKLPHLGFAIDAYFNYAVNALAGSVLIEKPLAVYRIHGRNNFTARATLNGMVAFRKETDDGARAAFFALEHMVAEFDSYRAQTEDIWKLRSAMRILQKKAGSQKWHMAEQIFSFLVKCYFAFVVKGLRLRFGKRSQFTKSTD